MISENDPMYQIDKTLDQLLINAQEMNLSKTAMTQKEMEIFQQTQENLFCKLISLDREISEMKSDMSLPKYKIQEKLQKLKKINRQFVDFIATRKNVLGFHPKRLKADKLS